MAGVEWSTATDEQSDEDLEESDTRNGSTHELERIPRYLRLFPLDPKCHIASRDPIEC